MVKFRTLFIDMMDELLVVGVKRSWKKGISAHKILWTNKAPKTCFSRELEVEISEKSCAKKLYFMNCEVNICLWIYDLFGNELP